MFVQENAFNIKSSTQKIGLTYTKEVDTRIQESSLTVWRTLGLRVLHTQVPEREGAVYSLGSDAGYRQDKITSQNWM